MESDKGVVMARDMLGSVLRRSTEQLNSITNRLLARCTETQESNTCEKPLSQTHVLIAVIIATALLLIGSALLVLFWLTLRRKKLEKLEDASDPFELAAYGIEEPVAQKQRRRDRLRAIMAR
ncbi:hypothetical protein LI328DRAFT_115300 [Trichoderma asperelloides]|nr:hypothetical protein LI328DRAFT_115300 [Trichoderma asperelloides]